MTPLLASAEALRPFLSTTLGSTNFTDLGKKYAGKVRDVYTQADRTILIATDRQSAFDLSWCDIPLKGQTLNQLSAWWFTQIQDIMTTHVVSVPDPNATVVKALTMVQVEIVVAKVPVRTVIETAKKVLYTGQIGDGKIFVLSIEAALRIRTGEADDMAL